MNEHLHSEPQPPVTPGDIQKSADRPGPTSKSVIVKPRKTKSILPRKEVHRSYTREFKLEVLSYLYNQQICVRPTTYRSPTEREVSAQFLVPHATLLDWIKPGRMEAIVNTPKSGRNS